MSEHLASTRPHGAALDGSIVESSFCPLACVQVGKNGKTGMLGQDRLEVRWEAVMFLLNVVNQNV